MKAHHHYIITDSVQRWSLKRGSSWLSFAPLPLPLACHCTVSLKGHLYVLGGWTPQVPVKQRCQYEPCTDGCTAMSLCQSSILHAAHAVFPFQALPLLPQHQPDDEPDKLSNLVFQFDPGKDRWTECASMKYSRYRCGAAVLNGEIYIVGGAQRQTKNFLQSINSVRLNRTV